MRHRHQLAASPAHASARPQRFERVFDEYFGVVTGYARRRAPAGEADDVVAETFLIAWRRIDEVPDSAKPWLLGVARRVLANRRRAASRRAALKARIAQEHEDTRELRERSPLLQALAGLSDGDREVLLLAAWDGLSTAEVGAVLDCSRPAAKVRLHRAKRRLRAELERLEHSALPQAPTRRLEECP